jgi:hypothetical protein
MRTITDRLPRAPAALAAVALATLSLAACTAASGSSPTPARADGTARPTPALPAVGTVPPTSAPVVGEVPADLVEAARADLASRIGSEAASAAEIVEAQSVTWPDGSLGCPVPGEMYVQVLTPGYRLVFEADGARYDYRLTDAGAVRLCELARPVP